MILGKRIRQLLLLIILACWLLPLSAATITETVTVSRQAGDDESIREAIEATKELAIQRALEKIVGIYLESYTELDKGSSLKINCSAGQEVMPR